ncbi:hypothetical protein FZC78_02145 [Rossellomorea vietnamensis]|uniref:Tubby C-terminal domain-containing protein n=1 Tax=Rossellomorea vietnamensis TaxID=218284 RepID=A0A5D4P1G5_9BACI|nr:hypothetical protein [Rossellomorea vietnamensis]TYS19851.1 hypothetical protein FZC78_02145 [Rossellomorea vietnamensis]
MYGGEHIPDWFLILVLIIVIVFAAISYLMSSGRVELKPGVSNDREKKAFYYENPLKFMTRPIEIVDVKMGHVGQIRREYNSVSKMFLSLLMPNYYVSIKGTDRLNDTVVRVEKIKGKKGIVKSSWEVELNSSNSNERFMIKGERKSPSNVIASFTFQNELIRVAKPSGEGAYYFYRNDKEAAKISLIGKLPPRKIFIDGRQGEIPLLLIAAIFEALKLYR